MGLEDYAIVVGIDAYAANGQTGFGPLTASVQDATRFIEWLRSPTGGDIRETPAELAANKRRIIPILSPPLINNQLPSPANARPVKDQIDDALEEFGVGNATKPIGNRLYFYFSGHGIGTSSRDIGMMMANAMQTTANRNVGLWQYREYLQERQLFDQIVFIADCCRDRMTNIQLGGPVFTLAKHNSPSVEDVTFLAARYKSKSFATQGGQGLLTQALLEGLNGHVEARDQRGRITSNTLGDFVKKRVKALAKQSRVAQDVELDPQPQNAEIVFTSPPPATVQVSVTAADRVTGRIEIKDGSGNSRGLVDATAAQNGNVWIVELHDSPIPYVLRMLDIAGAPLLIEMETVKRNNNEFHIA